MLEKRSLSIAGHRTSIALEPEFWARLEQLAAAGNFTLAALVTQIDTARTPPSSLASALRLRALKN